jgi:hypothetical protein
LRVSEDAQLQNISRKAPAAAIRCPDIKMLAGPSHKICREQWMKLWHPPSRQLLDLFS